MMTAYRILNTRPAHQSESLTRLIEKKGSFVFNLPVFEIQTVQFNTDNIDKFDYVVFLSANAVEQYFQQTRTLPHAALTVPEQTAGLIKNPRHEMPGISDGKENGYFFKGSLDPALKRGDCASPPVQKEIPQRHARQSVCIIAIGPATKLALEKAGIKNAVIPSQFNSDGILLMPEMQSVQHKKIAIISGENSKSILSKILKSRGAEVKSIICYRRNPISYDMNALFKKLQECNINFIISTSLESYFALLKLFEKSEYRAWIVNKKICLISDEMAKQAHADGFLSVIQAENATDEAILLTL